MTTLSPAMTTKGSVQEPVTTINIKREVRISAGVQDAWEALLEVLGPHGEMPDGKPFPFTLEAWPGGRWFRDLGNNSGHLWGHVQVIKPPALLEIHGPLFMSYAAVSHVQYRLKEEGGATVLALWHRAFGTIPKEDAEGVQSGWEFWAEQVRRRAEGRRTRG
jgi:hypothetical protein